MSDVLTLGENLGYLELDANAIRRGDIHDAPYGGFRWDEIDTPACPLGAFEYDLEIETGFGWFDAHVNMRGNEAILNDQHRRVLILTSRAPARFRVQVKKWSATNEQARTIDREVLLRILDSPLPAVREKGLEFFARFDRNRA